MIRPRGRVNVSTLVFRLVVFLIAAFLIIPTFIVIPMSFSSSSTYQFPPPGWSLQWYENLVSAPKWRAAALNSLQVALMAAPFATVVGTMGVFGLNRIRKSLGGISMAWLVAPMIVPNILLALSLYSFFLKVGLTDSLVGLALAHSVLAIPFVIIVVSARAQGLDDNLFRASRNLGASPMVAFVTVILPLMMPGILSGFVMAFITSFDEVVIAIFIHGANTVTLPVELFNAIALETDPTISAVSTVLVVAISLPIFVGQILLARKGK